MFTLRTSIQDNGMAHTSLAGSRKNFWTRCSSLIAIHKQKVKILSKSLTDPFRIFRYHTKKSFQDPSRILYIMCHTSVQCCCRFCQESFYKSIHKTYLVCVYKVRTYRYLEMIVPGSLQDNLNRTEQM